MSYIYVITNDINNKQYVGKTNFSIDKRFQEHINDSKRTRYEKRPLYNAMNKYGINHFQIQLVEECSVSELSDREIYWIQYYNSFNNGYNATKGGDGAYRIDYDKVVENYNLYHNRTKVAELMNISLDSVTTILKLYNITFETGGQVTAKQMGHKVACYDVKNHNFIKSFNNYTEAARWIIDNKYATGSVKTVASHISEVARGKRKTASGFKWEQI